MKHLTAARSVHIARELQKEYYVRTSLGLEVYIINAQNAPNTMQEIGRIREIEFRREGCGSGKIVDIDKFDTRQRYYKQLIVWDPQEQEIVSMYRFISGIRKHSSNHNNYISVSDLASSEIFEFSQAFKDDYLAYTIELGRSVVNKNAKRRIKGLAAVWSGLGALIVEYSDIKYFMGKITISPQIHPELRGLIYAMLYTWRGSPSNLIRPRYAVAVNPSLWQKGNSFKEDMHKLMQIAIRYACTIPSLILSYTRLSEGFQIFATSVHNNFSQAEESIILIPVKTIDRSIQAKYIDSYTTTTPNAFK